MADKPRLKLPNEAKKGEVIEIKTLMPHIMESGQRKDKDGKTIPRKIINKFACEFNGKPVFTADLEPAIAANPYLQFFAKVEESGTFKFSWTDDDGTVTTRGAKNYRHLTPAHSRGATTTRFVREDSMRRGGLSGGRRRGIGLPALIAGRLSAPAQAQSEAPLSTPRATPRRGRGSAIPGWPARDEFEIQHARPYSPRRRRRKSRASCPAAHRRCRQRRRSWWPTAIAAAHASPAM